MNANQRFQMKKSVMSCIQLMTHKKPEFQYSLLVKPFYFKQICIYSHDNAELQQITDE